MLRLARVAGTAAALVLAACSHEPDDTDDTEIPAGDCANDTLDGDETDVDCGGSCDIDCGIAQACASADDCMFGSCSAEVCVAPAGGPAATGPVTVTLLPEGSSIAFVSDEGVTMTLTVPPGAVREPFDLELVAHTPTAGSWLRLVASPSVLFAEPVTVTFTLPAGLAVSADANATFSEVEPGARLAPLPTTLSGSTATVSVRYLGTPEASGGQRDILDEMALELRRMELAQLVEVLTESMDSLEATFDARTAVEARLQLIALLQRSGDEDFAALVPPLMSEIKTSTCQQVATEMAGVEIDIDQGGSDCPWQAFSVVEPLLAWVAIGQQLSAYGDPCAVLDENQWRAPIQGELQLTEANVRSTDAGKVAAFRTCQCSANNPNPPQPEACTAPVEEDPFQAYVDGIYGNAGLAASVGVIGGEDSLRSGADLWHTEMVEPYIEGVWARAWTHCHDEGEHWVLGELAQAVDDPAPVLQDLQYCGTELGLSVEDSEGGVVDTATAGGEGVSTFTTAVSVDAPAGGTLVLGGPLRTLKCHPAGTENDSIVVKRVSDATTEVARRTGNAGGYLLEPGYALELDVDTLRAGLDNDEPLTLEVWRETGACGGAYGPTETKLFDVVGAVPPPWSVVVAAHAPVTRYSSIVANPNCPLTTIAADTALPVTLNNTCGSLTASMAAPDRIEVAWNGAGGADYVGATFSLRFQIDAPGTVSADIALPSGWQADAHDVGLWATSAHAGVFDPLPRLLSSQWILYVSPAGGTDVHTGSWHVEAGVGELWITGGLPPAGSGTLLVFEYAPDPASP